MIQTTIQMANTSITANNVLRKDVMDSKRYFVGSPDIIVVIKLTRMKEIYKTSDCHRKAEIRLPLERILNSEPANLGRCAFGSICSVIARPRSKGLCLDG